MNIWRQESQVFHEVGWRAYLGLSLVARQESVCLFDADTGLANVNILMAVSPRYTIEHVLNGTKTIDEIIIELPNGISLVPAASGIKQCTNLNEKQLSCLITAIQRILHFFTFSHAQFPPSTLSPLLKSVVWSSRALLDYLCYFIFPFYACIW